MATNNYDPDLFAGCDARYYLYKATIEGRALVVKVPLLELEPSPKLIDFTLTAVSTVMVMNHENVVKLNGCCLETCVPMPVFDIPPYRSLFHGFHSDNAPSNSLKWTDRLRIATGTAYALSYRQNALSKPVVHRNVTSLNVLCDYSFNAILTNFGYSISITPGQKPRQLPVEGAPGYIDPEYMETHEVTDKCDVYSFGVLLLELLTRMQPSVMARNGTNFVSVFVSMVEKDCMMQMIDREVMEQASRNEIQRVAQLAMTCVSKKGVQRPTMIEIVTN